MFFNDISKYLILCFITHKQLASIFGQYTMKLICFKKLVYTFKYLMQFLFTI